MANTYESKFKGAEVDEGVNIARNLTGTGGIEVKKTATGTINATVTIDGSGVKITPVSGTGTSTTDVMSQKAVTDELGKKQDKLTTGSEISIKKLQATTIGAQDNGSLTIVDPLTVSNNVYVNELEATKGVFSSGAIVQGTLTGETAHFATGVTVDGYSSFNGIYVDNSTTKPICFKRNGSIVTKMYGPTSGGGELVNVYLPGKGGTLALTSDIPTGGGGSAGVSSIGGKTGAITLGTGLSMNGNELSAEGGGGTTYYQHLLRGKYTHVSVGCDYQFYMTVISTQSSEAGGLTDLVLNSANITVGIDAAQSGVPQDYAGFVPAIMIDNPDDPANSKIFFVDTINNRSYAVAVEDTEFISDSVETL